MRKVIIVMGSDSDLSVMEDAVTPLREFGVPFEVRVISAHRTPEAAAELAITAEEKGAGVLIAGAGKAAHLAGFLAAHTTLPVIGVPIRSSFMDGLDSLLSTVQMPSGVPVATVGVNGARNAGLLAVQIIALGEPKLCADLKAYKARMSKEVEEKDAAVRSRYKNTED